MLETTEQSSQQPRSEQREAPPSEPQAESRAPASEPVSQENTAGDWRLQIAGDDTKAMEQLARYKTPGDFWKAHTELRTKLSERPTAVRLADDATPEQVAEYRQALGVAEVADDAAPDAYVKAIGIELPEGYEPTDLDSELINDFAKQAYERGHDPRVAKEAVSWYLEQQEAVKQAANTQAIELRDTWTAEMRQELGPQYTPTVQVAKAYAEQMWEDDGLRDEILSASLPGGGRLGDHPAFINALAKAAMASGQGDRIEATSMESGGKSLLDQQAELEALRTSDPGKYNAPETQARLDKILDLRLKRGEIDHYGNEKQKR